MRTPRTVFLDLHSCPPRPTEAPGRAVLCLGNFDGVHLAHATLIRAAVDTARNAGVPCCVFSFFRPSSDYLSSAFGSHLCTLREKLPLLAATGADLVCLTDFSELRDMPSQDFPTFLRESCGCIGIVCGSNYHYGLGGTGDAEQLASAFSRPGDAVSAILPKVCAAGGPISSTRIRAALSDGDPGLAATLLGRPYALESRVLHGKQLGRRLGTPTANQLFPAERLIPAHGVYATRVHTPNGTAVGVANIGLRPTVEDSVRSRVNCETYILDHAGDLYGQTIKVEFLEYLRPEVRFDTVDALREAILRDAERALQLVAITTP